MLLYPLSRQARSADCNNFSERPAGGRPIERFTASITSQGRSLLGAGFDAETCEDANYDADHLRQDVKSAAIKFGTGYASRLVCRPVGRCPSTATGGGLPDSQWLLLRASLSMRRPQRRMVRRGR